MPVYTLSFFFLFLHMRQQTFADGARYQGQWERGEMHGVGTLTSPDGTVVEGVWDRGKLAKRETHTTQATAQISEQTADAMMVSLGATASHWDLSAYDIGSSQLEPTQPTATPAVSMVQ